MCRSAARGQRTPEHLQGTCSRCTPALHRQGADGQISPRTHRFAQGVAVVHMPSMSSNEGWSARRAEVTSSQGLPALSWAFMPAAVQTAAKVPTRTLAFSSGDRPAIPCTSGTHTPRSCRSPNETPEGNHTETCFTCVVNQIVQQVHVFDGVRHDLHIKPTLPTIAPDTSSQSVHAGQPSTACKTNKDRKRASVVLSILRHSYRGLRIQCHNTSWQHVIAAAPLVRPQPRLFLSMLASPFLPCLLPLPLPLEVTFLRNCPS